MNTSKNGAATLDPAQKNGNSQISKTGNNTDSKEPVKTYLPMIAADKTGEKSIQTEDKKETLPVTLPTIEARLKKIADLQEQVERRETVVEAIANLNSFHIAPTGGANLKFTDSKSKTFGIAHPVVIGEMVNLAKTKLEIELANIEANINFSL